MSWSLWIKTPTTMFDRQTALPPNSMNNNKIGTENMNNKSSIIIGLAGAAGAGKDTLADILVADYGYRKTSFGKALYKEAAEAFGVTTEWLHDRPRKELPQPELMLSKCKDAGFVQAVIDHVVFSISAQPLTAKEVKELMCGSEHLIQAKPYDDKFLTKLMSTPFSPRKILQWWGTEYRRYQSETYWTDKVITEITTSPGKWAITDVRFDNEEVVIHDLGGYLVVVERDGLLAVSSHASEEFWRRATPDFRVKNNDSFLMLRYMTAKMLVQVGERHADRIQMPLCA